MKGSSPPLDCRLRSNYALWKSKNATAIEKILLKNILKASEKMTLYFHFTGGIDDMSILKVKQLKKYYLIYDGIYFHISRHFHCVFLTVSAMEIS